MINRMGKLSAVIAALSLVSVVAPLNYAEASTRLETKDGNFTKAVAFGNGTYVYNGYKDEDDASLYISDGEKNTVVDNIEDYDYNTLLKYSRSGLSLKDGEDYYLLELMSGKIMEESYETLITDNLALKLKGALKKTNRYGNINKPKLTEINNDVFGEKWYLYTVAPESNADGHSDIIGNVVYQTLAGPGIDQDVLMGFVSKGGKYIDTSSTANLYAANTESGKMIKVKEFNKESDNGNVTAKINQYMRVIGQDSGYIYTLINVGLEGDVNNNTFYIQKISKEPGEFKDGAYLPKSVTSYEISSAYDSDDAKDAFNLLFGVDNDYGNAAASTNITVKNGDIYVAQIKNDNKKVRITKLKLKKDKVTMNVNGQEKKVDQYLLEKDSDKDHDIVGGEGSLTIDADSNFWILDKGKIFKFDGEDFKEMYVCDRSLNNLDVYNDNNLVAWDSNGDVYSAVQNGMNKKDAPVDGEETDSAKTEGDKAAEDKAADSTVTENNFEAEKTQEEVKDGWVKNTDGSWSYGRDKSLVKCEWIKDNDKWYYLNENGIMLTGWKQDNSSWYYLNISGEMVKGWVKIDGNWYYFDASGSMLSNTTVDGYILGKDGALIK